MIDETRTLVSCKADIMRRIEKRLEVHRQSNYAGCGEMMKKAMI